MLPEIRRDITAILHTLNGAYTKLYDTLLQDVSMDVSTEIDTLEAMPAPGWPDPMILTRTLR